MSSRTVDADVPVLQSDLEFLHNPAPDAPSPYRGVYPGKSRQWECRVFQRRLSGRHPTPREAAKALVRWWRGRYGERWREVWAYRQTPGWYALACPGGWWGVAELAGEAAVVVGAGADGRPREVVGGRGVKPFPTRAAAGRGVGEWARGVWGAEARYRVRRVWCPTARADRTTPVPRCG